ncbi:MAG: MFS transporter [Burkholderiales bacterium]
MSSPNQMSPEELRASISLAGVFGLRMLGLFIILPVFSLYAGQLGGGQSYLLVGIALGAYGITQAILQIPFGWLSDRYGRKPIIYLGLVLFALGSFVAAAADNIYLVIIGRLIQGAGAVSAVVQALVADLTRVEHRTKAMAMIGGTIAVSFALSIILAPVLNRLIGVPGIFAMTGVLALLAIIVVAMLVPNDKIATDANPRRVESKLLSKVLSNEQLLRLNFGIFVLHADLTALFTVTPLLLRQSGMDINQHWQVYLPVVLGSFVLMLPAVMGGDSRGQDKRIFIGAIGVLIAAFMVLASAIHSFWLLCLGLLIFFTAFNVLEASIPAWISKIAPSQMRGTALSVHSIFQFLGPAVGGYASGFLYDHYGAMAVYGFCAALAVIWGWVALSLRPITPPQDEDNVFQALEGR